MQMIIHYLVLLIYQKDGIQDDYYGDFEKSDLFCVFDKNL